MSDNENNRDINESVFKSLLCFDEKKLKMMNLFFQMLLIMILVKM